MTTLASDWIRWFAAEWDASYGSAVLSGIVGDKAHARTGGYHISIEDQPSNNYSVVRVDDKAPPGDWSRKHSSAVDMSMNTADMVTDWNRVYAVWADHSDPRRKYFNGYNGWNGKGEAERLDFKANTRKVSTPDHKWHGHDETPRRYWNDETAMRAKLSVHRGESKEAYIARTTGGGDMGAAENADQANWWGGASMGPAVPDKYRALRLPAAKPVDAQGYFGNDHNSRLFYIQTMLEDLTLATNASAAREVANAAQQAAIKQLVMDMSQRPQMTMDEGAANTIAAAVVSLGSGATPEQVRAIVVEELDAERRDEAGRLLGPNSTADDEAEETRTGTFGVDDKVAPDMTAEERAEAETPRGTNA
jgi:hypothetical protein